MLWLSQIWCGVADQWRDAGPLWPCRSVGSEPIRSSFLNEIEYGEGATTLQLFRLDVLKRIDCGRMRVMQRSSGHNALAWTASSLSNHSNCSWRSFLTSCRLPARNTVSTLHAIEKPQQSRSLLGNQLEDLSRAWGNVDECGTMISIHGHLGVRYQINVSPNDNRARTSHMNNEISADEIGFHSFLSCPAMFQPCFSHICDVSDRIILSKLDSVSRHLMETRLPRRWQRRYLKRWCTSTPATLMTTSLPRTCASVTIWHWSWRSRSSPSSAWPSSTASSAMGSAGAISSSTTMKGTSAPAFLISVGNRAQRRRGRHLWAARQLMRV